MLAQYTYKYANEVMYMYTEKINLNYVPIHMDSNFLQEHVTVLSTLLKTTVAPQSECICVTLNVDIDPLSL
jgi:hypothetical protein